MAKKPETGIIMQQNSLQAFMSDQYVIAEFRDSVERKNSLVERVTNAIEKAIDSAGLQSQMDDEPKERWVACFTDQQLDDIKAQVVKLDQNAAGDFFAQLRKNGKYSDRIPIKKEIIEQGLTQGDVMLALQLKAIEKKLEGMIDTLSEIQEEVGHVRQGQQNDRIGLYMSAMNLYVESKSIEDPFFKKQILAQAIRGLSDSNSQLVKEMLDDVEYLVNRQYKKSKNPTKEMDKRIDNINKCFEVIHRSFVMKATVYYESNEIQAMLTVVDEYCRFMEGAIIPYAGRLREMDRTDKLLLEDKWDQRVESLSSMREVRQYIGSDQMYFLTTEKEGRTDGRQA